jgi:mRNA interferase RelE/StbE
MGNKRKLRVPDSTAERLLNLHPAIRSRIRKALELILDDPTVGKELREELSGLRSFPLGRYRIIYRIDKDVVSLVNLGPRSAIYQETAKLLGDEPEN